VTYEGCSKTSKQIQTQMVENFDLRYIPISDDNYSIWESPLTRLVDPIDPIAHDG